MASPRPDGHAAVPLAEWPAQDRAAFDAARVPASRFDDTGLAARWRPATVKALVGAYSRYLGFLQGLGYVLDIEEPEDRLTPEHLAAYIRFLRERCASVTVSSYLGQLHMFCRDVWPNRDWRWLCALQTRQHRQAEPSRDKAARIVPQQDLLQLGLDLMRKAEAMEMTADMPAGPGHPAIVYRDGFIIALLAMRPLRQRNMLALALGTSLREAGGGWAIKFPATETKTHTALNMPFPDNLVNALSTYLRTYRPVLLGLRGPLKPGHRDEPAGLALWVTRCGTQMTAGAMQKLLIRHTRARFGHTINPHLFRDCAATSLADDNPEHVRIAADLLGHKTFVTTATFYIAASQRRAMHRHQEVVMQRRRPGKR
jgi:integrase